MKLKNTSVKQAKSIKNDDKVKYILYLYINGSNPNSARAVRNSAKFCEKYLEEKYKLHIIDLHEHPMLSIEKNIVATPTLILKKLPDTLQQFIGDLSNIDHVLLGLNLKKL